jgi:transposase InsO family protein
MGDRVSSGKRAFDILCKDPAIERPLISPRHPQTNGMVERLNSNISEIVGHTRFGSAAELQSLQRNYLRIYNNSIHKAL